MTEDQKAMIAMVKHEDYERKDELLAILMNSLIKFDKKCDSANKPNYHQEPIPMRKNAEELEPVLSNSQICKS
ncbi:hypothetical protein B1B04_07730 [Lysinibacillus sp. KCTC 33748]|uniref:hypothetical protein n=1 Tax=unclassified Lysinibacillus TaxID=2636778 RepID=UPI0009A719EA|nr:MULTISPECIES: hypothetical protein [unclassified Lysinibacillus]OXS74781.1 hypothetical protein B1B04_07730 [Lysinibacillus sp. KCTC 33748]SKB57417.1 hypothetical protein SAMN06295926_10423 [Lysinibacillus sp. AC-3]